MALWKIYDADGGPWRTGIEEEEAKNLVHLNHAEGNTAVYVVSDEGERYLPLDEQDPE